MFLELIQYCVYLQLLASITGSQKISIPTSIVVSGIAKMFVGELIETGKFRIEVVFFISVNQLFLASRIFKYSSLYQYIILRKCSFEPKLP